jgi:hypothetical protein
LVDLAGYFYSAIGADNSAKRAACAGTFVGNFDGVVPALIKSLVLHLYDALWAGVHTKGTALATLKVEFEFHSFYIPFLI